MIPKRVKLFRVPIREGTNSKNCSETASFELQRFGGCRRAQNG